MITQADSKDLIQEEVPEHLVYLNQPQAKSAMIEANEEVAIWGRGTGKSEGLIAPRLMTWAHKMPRGLIGLVAATYQQHLTRTLPGIMLGLERMGFKRDRDYFIGKEAPANWGWERPAYTPIKTEYFIHFRTGAGFTLISQDRPGSANGLSLVAVAGDEAKFLNKEKLDQELMPAMRGSFAEFGDLSCYQASLWATDMPTNASGEWLFEAKERMDDTRVRLVLSLVDELHHTVAKMRDTSLSAAWRQELWVQHNRIQKQLNIVRGYHDKKGPLVYYSEASSLENVDVLRPMWFKKQQNNLHEHNFNTSILNRKSQKVRDGFYSSLSDSKHAYDMFDNNFLEHFYQLQDSVPDDCRQDGDVIKDKPLDIAMDYGGTFNCMVIGQRWPNDYRFIKNLFKFPPEKIEDLVLEFKRYYAPLPRKVVRYFYDHTAVATSAHNTDHYANIVMKILRRKDDYGSWTVIPKYIGQQPYHRDRHELWWKLLSEKDQRLPQFRYNRTNCDAWATSCNLTRSSQGRHGIEKDKSDEKRRANSGQLLVSQEKAPHLSDAGDTLIYGAVVLSGASSGSGAPASNV